jgi:hypothetical protein
MDRLLASPLSFRSAYYHLTIHRRKGRESNPQGIAALPFSRRRPSPIGLPFRTIDSRKHRREDSNLHLAP